MGSEGCRLRTASGHGRIIQHGDGSGTYVSQVSAYWYAALGQRIGKANPVARAFLICMISDRHWVIAVIVHKSGIRFGGQEQAGRSWRINPMKNRQYFEAPS